MTALALAAIFAGLVAAFAAGVLVGTALNRDRLSDHRRALVELGRFHQNLHARAQAHAPVSRREWGQ